MGRISAQTHTPKPKPFQWFFLVPHRVERCFNSFLYILIALCGWLKDCESLSEALPMFVTGQLFCLVICILLKYSRWWYVLLSDLATAVDSISWRERERKKFTPLKTLAAGKLRLSSSSHREKKFQIRKPFSIFLLCSPCRTEIWLRLELSSPNVLGAEHLQLG